MDKTSTSFVTSSDSGYLTPNVTSDTLHPFLTLYNDTKPWPLLQQEPPMVFVLTMAYTVVFLFGIVNNTLLVVAIYRNKELRTVTNYFIANLAVADILVCTTMPITLLHNVLTEWWYGPVVCKVAPYIQGVAVGTSVNTLAAVAMERYLAVFHSRDRRICGKTARILIAAIWTFPLFLFIPWIAVYEQKTYRIFAHDYTVCTAQWRHTHNQKLFSVLVIFLTCYLLPLVVIATFYFLIGFRVWKRKVRGVQGMARKHMHKRNARVICMLVAVFVVFFLSWLPLYAIEMRTLFGPKFTHEQKRLFKIYFVPLAQWLGASNSCVNPFIYVYFSSKIRTSIFAVLRSKSSCADIIA